MEAHFKTAALIGKYQTPEVADSLMDLAAYLVSRGVRVLIEEGTALSMEATGHEAASYEAIALQADVAIVVGGDGTMLNAASNLAQSGVPLVGVNQGRLGFMTDIARRDMIPSIGSLLAGEFSREERFLLAIDVLRQGEELFRSLALNDVVVNKGDLGRMIELEVRVDGEFVYLLRADGIIVATPTGSTAYALSANGPILHPSVPGIALVPLCPHALSNRPITLSDQSVIEVVFAAPHDGRLHFDGHTLFDARSGDCVRIARSRHNITLLHPPGYSYLAMLREKLHWSSTPRN